MTTINGICLESIKVSGYDIWKLKASQGPRLTSQYESLTYAAKNYTWIAQDFESLLRIQQLEGLNGQSGKRLEALKDRPEKQSEDSQGQSEAPSRDFVDQKTEIRNLEERIEDMERRSEDKKTRLKGMEEQPTDLQRQLRQLLKYYYLGMREASKTLAPTERSSLQTSTLEVQKQGVREILKDRLSLLEQVDEFGETLIIIEELLPATLSVVEPRAFQIPNISLLELLIHVKYSSLEAKPTTLRMYILSSDIGCSSCGARAD